MRDAIVLSWVKACDRETDVYGRAEEGRERRQVAEVRCAAAGIVVEYCGLLTVDERRHTSRPS
jgi:hypothetical protein